MTGTAFWLRSVSSVLEFPDDIDEDALVIERDIGEVIGEVGEVVPDAEFEVITEVAIDGGEGAGTCAFGFGEVEDASLDHGIPVLDDVQVRADHAKVGLAIDEVIIDAAVRDLPDAIAVFGPDGEDLVDVIGAIERDDMAALTRAEGFSGGVDLLRSGQIVEEGIAGQAVNCLLYTSPSPRDKRQSRMPSSA